MLCKRKDKVLADLRKVDQAKAAAREKIRRQQPLSSNGHNRAQQLKAEIAALEHECSGSLASGFADRRKQSRWMTKSLTEPRGPGLTVPLGKENH